MSLFAAQAQTTLNVAGMHCEKCVARVKEALENIDGVVNADVALEPGTATVVGNVDAQDLIDAVNALGFTATL